MPDAKRPTLMPSSRKLPQRVLLRSGSKVPRCCGRGGTATAKVCGENRRINWIMDITAALEMIKQGKIAPAYVAWGSRAFGERLVQALRDRLVDPAWGEMNFAVLDGRGSPAADVVALARSAPFGPGKKLIVVSNPPYLRKDEDGAIQGYLRDPAPWSVFVFLLDEKPPRSAPVRLVEEMGGLVDCTGRGSSVAQWVRSRAKANGKGITQDALWAICEMSSGDPDFIDTEIDKIVAYAHDSETITIDHVKQAGFGHSDARVFDLVDSIMKGDARASMTIAASLVLKGEDLQRTIQALAWHLRTLYRFKYLVRRGMSVREAAGEAGIHEFLFGKFSKEAAGLTAREIASSLEAILDIDVAVKSGLLGDGEALQVMIARLYRILTSGHHSRTRR